MEVILDGLKIGAKLAFQTMVYGNLEEANHILEQQVVDMEANHEGTILQGSHIGSRKLVKQGSAFAIKCLSVKPKYVVQAFGKGQFICPEFTYEGNFYNGLFHDNTGQAVFSMGDDLRFTGMFKNGLRQGVGLLEAYDKQKEQWIVKQKGVWQNNVFEEKKPNSKQKNNEQQKISIKNKIQPVKVSDTSNKVVISSSNKFDNLKELNEHKFPKKFNIKSVQDFKVLEKLIDNQKKNFIQQDNDLQKFDYFELEFKDSINANQLWMIQNALDYCHNAQMIDIKFENIDFQDLKFEILESLIDKANLQILFLRFNDCQINKYQRNELNSLNKLQQLKSFNLFFNNLNIKDKKKAQILNELPEFKNLQILQLNLVKAQLKKSNYSSIFELIKQNESLVLLNLSLSQQNISEQSFTQLLETLSQLNNLRILHLDLYQTQISFQQIDELISYIIQSSINKLYLYVHGNKMDNEETFKLQRKIEQKQFDHKIIQI